MRVRAGTTFAQQRQIAGRLDDLCSRADRSGSLEQWTVREGEDIGLDSLVLMKSCNTVEQASLGTA